MYIYEQDECLNEEVEDFLEHFGVLGMKWGVRKQEKREAKAQKFLNEADIFQTRISEIESKRFRDPFEIAELRRLRKGKARVEKQAEAALQGKRTLTRKQKQVLIGTGVATAAIAGYGAYSSIQSGNARRLMGRGKYFLDNWQRMETTPWKKDISLSNQNLNADEIMEKVVGHVNPDFGKIGTKMNCRRATYAYEMRRRGFDVAATRTSNARGQDITGPFNALNPGVNLVPPGRAGMLTRLISEVRKPKAERRFTQVVKEASKSGSPWGKNKIEFPGMTYDALSEQPDGARGELGIGWNMLGGHSMSWEKIKGTVHVFDNQTNKKYSSSEELNEFLKNAKTTAFTRLDDAPLNSNFLMRWLKDA